MALNDLSEDEKNIVFECLKASAEGPFFPEWEFHLLFGINREDIVQILSQLPDIDEQNEKVVLAVNNSMNNLTGYPHNCQNVWSSYISVSPADVSRIFNKWRKGKTF